VFRPHKGLNEVLLPADNRWLSRVVSGTKLKNSTSLSSKDVVKGDYRINSIYTWDRLRSVGDRLTTCHVCSVTHSQVVLVERGRLGGIFGMPLLPLWGYSLSGMIIEANNEVVIVCCAVLRVLDWSASITWILLRTERTYGEFTNLSLRNPGLKQYW
jgi:hypothetical protein